RCPRAPSPPRKPRRRKKPARRTRRRTPPAAGGTAPRQRPGTKSVVSWVDSFPMAFCRGGQRPRLSKRTPPRAVPGVIPVGVFNIEDKLLRPLPGAAGAGLVGQPGPAQGLEGVVQILFGLKGVKLHPVAQEQPEFDEGFHIGRLLSVLCQCTIFRGLWHHRGPGALCIFAKKCAGFSPSKPAGSHIFTIFSVYTFSGIHLLPHFDKSTRKKAFPMHTAARRILPALLLLLALLVSALPRALAAGLENCYGIQMLDFDEDQILSIGNQAPGQCSLYALRYARTVLDRKCV